MERVARSQRQVYEEWAMRARAVVAAVAAVYLILPPHPKNKEQKLKLEKMVFKDWSESKNTEQNIGSCLVFGLMCAHVVDNQQRGGVWWIDYSFNFLHMLHTNIIAVSF